ncbi:transcriptional repressor LexA [Acidihalobacter prosperus]|uniref:Repressor LexA n=1 Tax=Acidihalobacter prosperus TaxID=160660 RepID=A0A1A6C4L5_9GAMM|nr:transcriptional repressor LexA [Acidihalobacter prosperus]OBS09506.1 repressor LexA [Acidihalobacter prosperus]
MHPRQSEILQCIRDYATRHGRSPTLAEIGATLGVGRNTVHYHVQSMLAAGLLERESGWRGLRIPQDPAGPYAMPLAGRIAAGRPIEAIPGQEHIDLSAMLLGPDRFALIVKGDSMIDAGIFDGDYVVMARRDSAEDGDIVAALIDDEEATLKRLRRTSGGEILLIPENVDMAPMHYSPERVRIQGVLVAQFRRYR